MTDSGIFKAAVKLPAEQRAAYLNQACGDNQALRQEVESLLQAHDVSGSLLEELGARSERTGDYQPLAEGPGTHIGPYKLLQQIGEGGMGVVFMAEQTQPVQRRVALKIIKPGMDSHQVIARFEAERQALALMDHPNIAKVLDAGATETGRPYFVMELVKGRPITLYCDERRLTPRQRLELFLPVCQAVQHAHQKGIIHRDLKPSNVLIALYDGKPVPKVIDFGVAKATGPKLTGRTLFTEFGQIVGTLEYMSPEQAELNQLDIDTRSDLYSLGVLLYELLTGTTPLEKKRLKEVAVLEVLRLIREAEPPRPSTRLSTTNELPSVAANRGLEPKKLSGLIRGELDWIVMKCLEKDRNRRYETANGLAMDLQRYLHDEPVEACPPSAGYRLRKLAHKYRIPLTVAAAFALLLVAGVVVSAWQAMRATQAEHEATRKRLDAEAAQEQAHTAETNAKTEAERARVAEENTRRQWYAANLSLMQKAWDTNEVPHLRALLAETQGYSDRGFEWYYWQRQCHLDLHTLIGHRAAVSEVSWSPDGKRLATASWDGTAKVWDASSGQELFPLKGHTSMVSTVSWSPDGKRLATGGGDHTARVWDAADGRQLLPSLSGHMHGVWSVSWSPDGKRLATGSGDGTAKVWDAADSHELLSFNKGHTNWVVSVSWSPDGKRLATASWDGTAKVWEATSGQELFPLNGHTNDVGSVSWSPDGRRLATASEDGTAKVWDAGNGGELFTLKGHAGWVQCVSWSPDGQRLATASGDGTAKVWEAVGGRELLTLKGHTSELRCVSWSPDGQRLATASADGTAKVWDAAGSREFGMLRGHNQFVLSIAWSSDGQRLATSSKDGTAKVWHAAGHREPISLTGHTDWVSSVSWSPDDTRVATASEDGTTKVWAAADGRELLALKGRLKGRRVCWSPDGTRLATVSEQAKATVWDAADGRQLLPLQGHRSTVTSVSWSPDSKWLATGSADGTAIVWDGASGQQRPPIEGHTSGVRFLSWSQDGERLATGSDDGTAKVWNAADGRELLTLKGHTTAGVSSLSWSKNGKRLATGSDNGTTKVWDAASGQELLTLPGSTVSWSPDGKRMATGSTDGTVKVWEAATADAVQEWARQDQALQESLVRNALSGPDAQGFIQSWLLLLPFRFDPKEETGAQALDRQQLPGEAQLRPWLGKEIPVNGRQFVWQEHRSPQAILDFNAVLDRRTEYSVAYAVCYLESDRPRNDLRLQVGSDDQAKVYLNGIAVYKFPLARTLDNLDMRPVTLKQGSNVLVLKVVNEMGPWKGCVRLVDKAGRPAQGIRVKLTPEP